MWFEIKSTHINFSTIFLLIFHSKLVPCNFG